MRKKGTASNTSLSFNVKKGIKTVKNKNNVEDHILTPYEQHLLEEHKTGFVEKIWSKWEKKYNQKPEPDFFEQHNNFTVKPKANELAVMILKKTIAHNNRQISDKALEESYKNANVEIMETVKNMPCDGLAEQNTKSIKNTKSIIGAWKMSKAVTPSGDEVVLSASDVRFEFAKDKTCLLVYDSKYIHAIYSINKYLITIIEKNKSLISERMVNQYRYFTIKEHNNTTLVLNVRSNNQIWHFDRIE